MTTEVKQEMKRIAEKYRVFFVLCDSGISEIWPTEHHEQIFRTWLRDAHIVHKECLSEDFMREFKDEMDWHQVASQQKLSENFIREFKNMLPMRYVSTYQKLSEDFIRELSDIVCWECIFIYQELSEGFIREFIGMMGSNVKLNVINYQKLSVKFRKELSIELEQQFHFNRSKWYNWLYEGNWLYKSKKLKLKYIKEKTNYEVIDDEYIIAYKSVRDDRYSVFNFQYQYLDGETYESHCDCHIYSDGSFGLSAWTLEGAKNYYSKGIILKVRIAIGDVGAIVKDNQKIRCSKLTVIEKMN